MRVAAALADLKRRGIRPKYIYTIPTVQNPTGTIMGEQRRLELLRLSEEYGVPIFEDDCYADLIWDGRRPPALYAMSKRGGVIHIGSFSKSIAPALRVGYIVAPWEVLSRMLPLKTDAGSGALEQMVLAEFCASHFDEHVPKLTRGLRAKLETLMDALAEQFGTAAEFEDPKGGIFLWVKLPDVVDTQKLAQASLASRRRHQSRPGMVDRQGLQQEPDAALLRQSLPRRDPPGRRRCSRRSAGASSACLNESPMWSGARRRNPLWRQPACSSSSTSAPRKSPGWMNAMRSPATLCCGLPPPSTRTPSCARPRTVSSTSSTPRQKW